MIQMWHTYQKLHTIIR